MSIGITTAVLFAVFAALLFLGCPISVGIVISSIVAAVSSLSWDQITSVSYTHLISINIPITSRITFISSRITYLLEETDIIAVLMAAGIPEYAITKDIAEEAEIRNRIMPVSYTHLVLPGRFS